MGSIWSAVLFHASHNAFLRVFFDPMTVMTGRAGYSATEGGLGIAVAYGLVFAALPRLGGVPVFHAPVAKGSQSYLRYDHR